MRYAYPCVLTPEEGGGFFVRFPDVPGALTCGDDRAEALLKKARMAEDALAVALAGYVQQQRDIPAPSSAKKGQEIVTLSPVMMIVPCRREARAVHGNASTGRDQGGPGGSFWV